MARFHVGDIVPMHRHADLVEVFFLLEGEMTLRLEDEDRPVLPEDTVVVYPGSLHGFRSRKASTLLYFSMAWPPNPAPNPTASS